MLVAKNVKSIVWPPPNPPEDEPETETNPNLNESSYNSDLTSLSEEKITLNTNTNKVNTEIKSSDQTIPPLTQTMDFSSNSLFDSTQMASSSVKSQTAVQEQRSEMKQEFSSCTVQSYSQQASDSKQFSVYQSHIGPDEINKQIQNVENARLEHSSNVMQSKFKTAENVSQNIQNPNTNVANIKMQPCSDKTRTPKVQARNNQFSMAPKVSQPGAKASIAKKPVNEKPIAGGMSGLNPSAKKPTLQRGSLLEALTIAPERPYSPLSFHIPSVQYNKFSSGECPPLTSEVMPPLSLSECGPLQVNPPYQSSTEQYTTQNSGTLQSSNASSAFKPVCKQTFPPPMPEEFSSQIYYPTDQSPNYKEFCQSKQETLQESMLSESMTQQQESSFVKTGTGLYMQESNPSYQQAVVPEVNNPGLLQKSFNPTNVINTNMDRQMTFQPVVDETSLRISPAQSRPTTPGMINKPAPIIPHYQMNLVTVEHQAPESRLYKPVSAEDSRSSTPLARCRSPAPGPPSNLLKAQAPRIKQATPQSGFQQAQSFNSQVSNFKREQDITAPSLQTQTSTFTPSEVKANQPTVIKDERQSNVEYRAENYNKGDMNVKEDSMLNQNYGERQTQSQNISEYGNTTVQTTKKTFEEFESSRSAKFVEIRKGGSQSSGSNQQYESNIQPYNSNLKQVFPPPLVTMTPTQQNLLHTNDSVVNASKRSEIYQPTPFISGANQDPVCDPTPSTGSSVGAAVRGKAFGVPSAPKRGRGILNKAAVPGSRVPLCGSCNGNIRGPFITALGRIWCPEHFICVNATCRRQLQDIGFVEENGQLYCEYCFEQYIAPSCDKCHNKIKEDCLNAIGKRFHPECFSCVYCGKLFGNNPFFLEDGLPYCEADWNELFTTKCFACGFPVEAGDRWVEALNNNYHCQCFNCTVCKKNLQGQRFVAKGGRPYCKSHAR